MKNTILEESELQLLSGFVYDLYRFIVQSTDTNKVQNKEAIADYIDRYEKLKDIRDRIEFDPVRFLDQIDIKSTRLSQFAQALAGCQKQGGTPADTFKAALEKFDVERTTLIEAIRKGLPATKALLDEKIASTEQALDETIKDRVQTEWELKHIFEPYAQNYDYAYNGIMQATKGTCCETVLGNPTLVQKLQEMMASVAFRNHGKPGEEEKFEYLMALHGVTDFLATTPANQAYEAFYQALYDHTKYHPAEERLAPLQEIDELLRKTFHVEHESPATTVHTIEGVDKVLEARYDAALEKILVGGHR